MKRLETLLALEEFLVLPEHKKSYLIFFVYSAEKELSVQFESRILDAEAEMRKLKLDYSDLIRILRKVNQ